MEETEILTKCFTWLSSISVGSSAFPSFLVVNRVMVMSAGRPMSGSDTQRRTQESPVSLLNAEVKGDSCSRLFSLKNEVLLPALVPDCVEQSISLVGQTAFAISQPLFC